VIASSLGIVGIALAALLIGLAVGWFGHRRAWTWCARCGQPLSVNLG
jgi:hypothetical protein